MKILAIRGSNLASLDGEFCVDFTLPSFSQNGLIAITGSTGSGKSTLLDALCLALFNRIPRLPSRGSQTLIGREDEDDKQRLASHDVRHILRRGTGEAYAEVDFVGVDKKYYRATWTLRRARKRPDGRFQTPEHAFICLKEQKPLGRTRTEIEQIIVKKLGLSFDQFRRSVLLAQGDFASFLKADAATRSRLLEMITGTEIYGEISRQAHLRANAESAELQQLQVRLNEYDVLEPELREQLERSLSDQNKRLEQQQQCLGQWQEQADWFKQLKHKKQQLTQAEADLALQQKAWDKSKADRQALERLKQLEALRLPLQRLDDAKSNQEKTLAQLQALELQQQSTEKNLAKLATKLEKSLKAYKTSETAYQKAQPDLRQAYQLDSQLQQVQVSKEQQELKYKKQKRNVASLQQTTKQQQAVLLQLQDKLSQVSQHLFEQKADEPLAAQWTHWQSLFDDLIAIQQVQHKDDLQLRELEQSVLTQAHQLDEAKQKIQLSNTQLEQCEASLLDLNEGDIQKALAECIEQLPSLQNQLLQLNEQEQIQRQFAEKQAEQKALQEELQALQIAIEQAEQSKQQQEIQLAVHNARLDEALQVHKRALLATGQSAEQLRAQLSDDKPCPVCGSHDHPWQGNNKLHALADAQDKRVQELQSENNGLKKRYQQLEFELASNLKQQKKQLNAQQANQQKLESIQTHWGRLSQQEITTAQPKKQIIGVKKQLEKQQTQQKQLQEQQAQIDKIRKQKEAYLKQLNQQQAALQVLEVAIQKSQSTIESLQQQKEKYKISAQAIIQRLAEVVDQLDMNIDLHTLKQACQKRAKQYLSLQEQQQSLEKQINDSQQELEKQQLALSHAEKLQREVEQEYQQLNTQLETLQQSRQALLVGYKNKTTEQIETVLKNAVEQAKADYEGVRQEYQTQDKLVLAQATSINDLQQGYDAQLSLSQKRSDELQQALRPFEINEDEARKQLTKDKQWIVKQEQAIQNLQRALQASQIHLETAQADLSVFVAGDQVTLQVIDYLAMYSDDDIVSKQALIKQEQSLVEQKLAEIQQQINELEFQFREDDNKRKQTQKLQKAYDKQAEITHIWKVMKELIGSQSGSKFRNFAQSLTLEILLSYANQRMQELNRRYALQRVPQTDLELQIVDKEMGDEIRPVHSLSGGESFLVSLALALGLASLSSRKTQIDSLFIDEGFGTLDPQTLDTALSALDSLQAQGKTVCIISHVSAINERVAAQIKVKACGNGKSIVELAA